MEGAAARDHSSDSIATSDEFEDLGPSKTTRVDNGQTRACKTDDLSSEKPSPEMEIGNNGNLDYLQETLNEVLDEETTLNNESPPEDDNCAIFNRIAYLGAATVNAPRSENELQRNMAILSRQSSGQPIEVKMTVPNSSDGSVVLYDVGSSSEMARYPIHRTIFFARGPANTLDASCFAFTCPRGDSEDTVIFQCHVFRCEIPEAVTKVMASFVQAFKRSEPVQTTASIPNSPGSSASENRDYNLTFDVTLEIREEDSKGNYGAVPKDRNYFKIRSGIEKKIVITVQQTNEQSTVELPIERCFGLLVASGRTVKNSDMHLLEMVSMGTSVNQPQSASSAPIGSKSAYVISGHWDPNEPVFTLLNKETTRDINCVYMTVAVDLVIRGISEPVRFVIETRVKVFAQNERFWYFSKKQLNLQYTLQVTEVRDGAMEDRGERQFRVVEIRNDGEIERPGKSLGMGMALSLNLSSLSTLTSSTFGSLHSPTPSVSVDTPKEEELSDNDEPLLSGSGEVSKDCSEMELASWAEVLHSWNQGIRPKQLSSLVRRGIPEALRGEVWLRLSECSNDTEIMDAYRILITKECSADSVILRDIHRTFPAHDFFKDSGGLGQEALAKISRAYAVYDEEVGYCQGLSFLAAALLLHMPEEQAFCVLVRIMFHYGLRDLFKDGFETLHLRLYQLDRLIEEHLPELWNHLVQTGIESHMYASQWFLTLFTAKFPLFLVFHILDVFLCQGMETIFQVALGLLAMAKKDLLALNFEGILKYFRVQLPKRYRNEDAARQLMKLTATFKLKKVKKYEKEWLTLKEQEQMREDPLVRLERENKHLREANLRLERESDDLAQELITSKIGLRAELDAAEEKADSFYKELQALKRIYNETEEDRKQIQSEAAKVKVMLKREVQRAEDDARRSQSIIADYKQICNQLGQRLEDEQRRTARVKQLMADNLSSCCNCSAVLEQLSGELEAESSEATPSGGSRGGSGRSSTSPETKPKLQLTSAESRFEQQVRELELELAQTKLALVEAECRSQDLTHQLTAVTSELHSSPRNNWLQKTLSSIKEVTKKEVMKENPLATARRDSSSSEKQ